MERLYAVISLIMITVLSGCMPVDQKAQRGPADVSMARHIRKAHHVQISDTAPADILVWETNNMIAVRFSDDFLKRVDSGCLTILNFQGPEQLFCKPDYLNFLDQLHAYLVLSPPKKKEKGVSAYFLALFLLTSQRQDPDSASFYKLLLKHSLCAPYINFLQPIQH